MNNYLVESKTFYELMLHVRSAIQIEIDDKIAKLSNIYMEPSPFQSLLMNGCMESARDISMGAKYNNYGFHGTGLATAADSLAALKLYVYDKKEIKPDEIINAVKNNFADYEELWKKVKYESPKMGNDDDYVDQIAMKLMEMFSDALMNLKNERGGNFRPGSGSAMYYLWHAKDIGASADGRKKGEPLSANYSPSLNTKLKGPISIIKSFSKPDLKKIMNGGPLTMEIHDTVFSNSESIRKTAMLVKSYMDLGGLQLQINAVNKDTLLDAQKNPDQYKNLIVRVWGWSGYFVELDKEYQDHIIQRIELQV
jgi:formate C-acetyltransferase